MNNKSKEINALLGKASDDNKTVYYEKEPGAKELPPLDPKNFVKLPDVKAELTKTPELDGKLRHLVPPQVRADVQMLTQQLNQVLQMNFDTVGQQDQMLAGFLAQFQLPGSL
jgi:hypothetical protein